MNILLCSERFLFRFGVDRALIMLGQGLARRGHTITVAANRFDRMIVEGFAQTVLEVPSTGIPYLDLNEATATWLDERWEECFAGSQPDVVIIAGWPFLTSIPVFRRRGCCVVCFDCGAVPLDGFEGGVLVVQRKLRELRRSAFRAAHAVIGISRFIVESQSKSDAGDGVPAYPLLLGVDHIEHDLWSSSAVATASDRDAVQRVDAAKLAGKKVILNLGRWETGCYKNSGAAVRLIEEVRREIPEAVLAVLAREEDLTPPPHLAGAVIPVGFPSDAALKDLMQRADLGVSVSLWEGFNLPLGEMQWLERPVLVFNAGAHPEVVLHPWYLCQDAAEMGRKAIEVLNGGGPAADEIATCRERYRDQFSWEKVVDRYQQTLVTVRARSLGGYRIVIDVTNAARDEANSGVIRVTRRVCRELQDLVDPVFVVWEDGRGEYVMPTASEYSILGRYNGPTVLPGSPTSDPGQRVTLNDWLCSIASRPSWLLLTETVLERRGQSIRRFARQQGMRCGAIFYDAIPVLHPELCKDLEIRANHAQYMTGLAECDLVVPISGFSAECLEEFWRQRDLQKAAVVALPIAGDFASAPRPRASAPQPGPARILCVSTLEPRKNHVRLIAACERLVAEHPELEWTLSLVGNRYAGAPEIVEAVERATRDNPHIRWLGVVDDRRLQELYAEATFTVYPSLIEGFGLPIIESLWYGKPCLVNERGVMSELAREGGCLTTDMQNEARLAADLYRLVVDTDLRARLRQEAAARNIETWMDYAGRLVSTLMHRDHSIARETTMAQPALNQRWTDVLYANCLCDNWQMNDSERLSLTALLCRQRPRCAVEIGTYQGGSLSLIAQFAEMVFSIDIDPSVPTKFGFIENASFLTGPSTVVLPILVRELDEQGIPIDLLLLDGDHSEEGVRRDLEAILRYKPRAPMFLVMHDSFNPGCRRGMLAAPWQQCPYVHWVDLDFVPGRIVEHGGGGDGQLWGGLGLAYLAPSVRQGELVVQQSARKMQQLAEASWRDGRKGLPVDP